MDFKTAALTELRARRAAATRFHVVAGLDGFVDTIVVPVGRRAGVGENFTAIATIEEFGRRILAAAGKSTNLELYPRMDKLGGNGPIMANALLAQGMEVTYVGALGAGAIHPVFQPLAGKARVVSIASPASTIAVEFDDGKLMLGQMRSLDDITYAALVRALGEAGLLSLFASADLIALVNWTMIPAMTAIFETLVAELLPRLPPRSDRHFFFDLADPEKRSTEDLLHALEVIARFEKFGRVTLGLNLKEAQRVGPVLDIDAPEAGEASLKTAAAAIRSRLGIGCVVLHPKESAACATAAGAWWLAGPYVAKPQITTGAGDHFNAGFGAGQLLGLSPASCLALGVSTSGCYVRTGESPSLDQTEAMLASAW